MSTQNRFPKKDAEFNDSINIRIPYLNANKTRLVTTPAAQALLTKVTASLNTAGTGWNSLYPASQNPAVSTVTIVNGKTSLRKQIEEDMREIFADIPKSVLTQTDRDTLNLPLPLDTRTPVSKPTVIPTISIGKRAHLSVRVDILDSDKPQGTAKPSGVGSIQIEGAFLPAGSATDTFPQELDFRHLTTTGKTNYTRDYQADQLKGTEYLRARYLSTRNEPGNWSEWVAIVVA